MFGIELFKGGFGPTLHLLWLRRTWWFLRFW